MGGFLIAAIIGAAAGAFFQYRVFEKFGEAELSANLMFRLHGNALIRLNRPAEALDFQDMLVAGSLPYLSSKYSTPSEMPKDLRANVAILRAYHERFPLAGLSPESEQWLKTVPDPELPKGCKAALVELLAKK